MSLLQFLEKAGLSEPAKWVKDENVWDKAKKVAKKADAQDPWALTTYLYKKMGGEIKPKKEDDKTGVQTTHWFWGAEAFTPKKEKKPHVVPSPEVPSSADQAAQKLLLENPNIPAATLLNALKSQGIELVDSKKQIQADSGTSQIAVQRESFMKIRTEARFTESQTTTRNAGVGPLRFKVALIQEGLGNLRDAFFYGKEAIKSGIQAFEGRKCFADHPSMSEEQDRPERSVRDIIGHFENVAVEENQDGSLALVADLVMPPDPPFEWARSLVRQATDYNKKYPEQNFVGLSINANGDAQEVPYDQFIKNYKLPESCKTKLMNAQNDGMETVKLVTAIKDAVSCDLVTEPGARGKILEILETERKIMKKENEKKGKLEAEEKKKMMTEESEEEKMHASEEEKKEIGNDEDHEDIEKDKKLILDMIKKHMGHDEEEEMESEGESAALEAYQAYKEMGESEDEAMKCAGKAMKLAKHMAEKKAKMESEMKHAEAEEEKKESEPKHKESNQVVKLEARLAFLEREIKKRDLDVLLDSKLKESGLGRAETDRIRKLIGTPKNESHVLETIKIFKEAFESRSQSAVKSDFFVSLEKQTAQTKRSKVSFNECL